MRSLFVLAILSLATLQAQVAEKANERYRTPEGRETMLENLAAADRAQRMHADAIVKALELKPGMSVADLGTGGGALLPLLSAAVGPRGKVYAEDIYSEFLDGAKARNSGLANVTYVLGTDRDPKLAGGSCDVAVTVDAYHHYDYPAEMLAAIRRGLKPGGRLAIADYFKRPGAMGAGPDAVEHIRLDRDDVIKEVEANGFKMVSTQEFNPGKNYLVIFVPAK